MWRELIATAPNQLAFREGESLPVRGSQIRVKSLFGAAKHGTELSLLTGTAVPRGGFDVEHQLFDKNLPNLVQYPLGLGNMCMGEILEVGPDVAWLKVGDWVFHYGSFRTEHTWFAEQVRLLPDGVPWQAAACLDPADFALDAIRTGNVRLGDAVAVFGMGAIGLVAMQLAKVAGAYPVIAVEPIASRRAVALACGADLVLDPTDTDVGLAIKKATNNRGADVCIEYSGSHLALQAALRGVAYLGTVVAGAWPSAYPAGLDFGAEAHFNRPKIVFSRASSEPSPDFPAWNESRLFDVVWRLLSNGHIKTEPIIQPVVAFDDLLEAYPKIATNPEENIKLGVQFM